MWHKYDQQGPVGTYMGPVKTNMEPLGADTEYCMDYSRACLYQDWHIGHAGI